MSLATFYEFQVTSRDGLQIASTRWYNGKRPRGIIQIAHGMGEHIGRYQNLIEALVEAGLVVYGNDHRGQQLEEVRVLMGRYQRAGVCNLSHHFYPGGRHEMLNETNRSEVMKDLLLWISKVLRW